MSPGGDQAKSEPSHASKGQTSRGEQSKGQPSQGQDQNPPKSPSQEKGKGNAAAPVQTALKEAETNQQEIVDELQKMLDGLSEFETYRGVVKDAQNLLKEQEQAMKQAADAAGKPEMMGKTPDALNPEQKAELANVGSRQGGLSKELQDLQAKMDDMAKRMDESDPLGGAALREAAQNSRKQGTAAKMGEAADQLEKNQMGAARTARSKSARISRSWSTRSRTAESASLPGLSRSSRTLRPSSTSFASARPRTSRRPTRRGTTPTPRPAPTSSRSSPRSRPRSSKSSSASSRNWPSSTRAMPASPDSSASSRMGQAQQNLDQDQGEQAEQEEEEALADLDDAEDEVKQARRDAEEQLAMEQLVKMADHLKSLAERQDKIVQSTDDYERLRNERKGQLTIAQRSGVRSLGRVQEGLKDETDELVERLEGAPVFALTLKRAVQNMKEGAELLQGIKTDTETQRAVKGAAKRFAQLLESLKPDKPKGGNQQQQQGGDPGNNNGGANGGDGIPAAAQVKMLKALQEEINERTEFYDELKQRKTPLTPEQTAEIEKLEGDQGTLADLARDLTRPKKDDGEE